MIAPLRAAVLSAVAALVLVATAGDGRAAFTYDLSLGAGVMRNDNLHLDPRTPVEDELRQPVRETILTVTPGVQTAWESERDFLHLDYSGEYQRFSGDEERDPEWVHTIAAVLNWRRWAPFFLEAGEERARVPRSQERETEAVVDQIDQNRASVRSGFGRELGTRGVVELAYRGELENYPGVADADRVLRQSGEGLWRYRWTPLWETELRAAYGFVERDLASDYTEARASAAVEQRLNERMTLVYGLEWVREEDDEPGEAAGTAEEWLPEERTSLLKSAALSGDLEHGGVWELAYEDSLAGLPEGDTLKTRRASARATQRARLGSSLRTEGWHETRDYRDSGRQETAWGPVIAARWMIAPWLAADLAGSWTSTAIRERGQEEVVDRTGRVAAGFVALLYDRLALETGYGYRKNGSTDALRSYSGNVAYVLLTFHFRRLGGRELPASYASSLVTPGDTPGQTSTGDAGTAAGAGR